MIRVRILSIPGSGTRWLSKQVFADIPAHTYHVGIEGRTAATDETVSRWLRERHEIRVFVPIRDPVETIITNMNHGRRVGVDSFRVLWHWWMTDKVTFVPVGVPLDEKVRVRIQMNGGNPDAPPDPTHSSIDHTGLRTALETGAPDADLDALVAKCFDTKWLVNLCEGVGLKPAWQQL